MGSKPTVDWLDEVEAQVDSTVPYYVPKMIAEIRRLRGAGAEASALPQLHKEQEMETRQSSAPEASSDRISASATVKAASHYFHEGRCSGHAQFKGNYCRDAAPWDRWCIHCAGLVLLRDWKQLLTDWREQDSILQQIAALAGDEHVTCAADVLTAVRQALAEASARPHQERKHRDRLLKAALKLAKRNGASLDKIKGDLEFLGVVDEIMEGEA